MFNSKTLLLFLSMAVSFSLSNPPDTMPPFGIIDFYGLHTISETQARKALQIKEGDSLSAYPDAAQRRLESLPVIVKAHLNMVCCEQGKSILYVGVQEKGAATLKFRPAPQGKVLLPEEIFKGGEAFGEALTKSILKGDAQEDDTQGHALNSNPEVRAIQERFIAFAARDLKLLRDVLRHSADPEHRALAAQVMAYSRNKQAVVSDLEESMHDPADGVRNNAMRALMVMARASLKPNEQPIKVSAQPFIEMLNSLFFTDRNKSSWALYELTSDRDPATLARLRKQALPSLIEMAKWKTPGHAQPAFMLLGRIGGLTDEDTIKAWDRKDYERVIKAAREAAVDKP